MKRKRLSGFTLAEVLITLAIIGVVAALSIPAVISNSQQQEFKTGLRKAVSVLNSAITMNMALDGESPYDNANLMGSLMKHMAVVETGLNIKDKFLLTTDGNTNVYNNSYFYTTDGMRYEFPRETREDNNYNRHILYENPDIIICSQNVINTVGAYACGGCGSYGLNGNSGNTTKVPCLVSVDINGDKKPNPANVNCLGTVQRNGVTYLVDCASQNRYKYADPLGLKLTDLFSIMITDKQAIPYGVAAQRAMYQARK